MAIKKTKEGTYSLFIYKYEGRERVPIRKRFKTKQQAVDYQDLIRAEMKGLIKKQDDNESHIKEKSNMKFKSYLEAWHDGRTKRISPNHKNRVDSFFKLYIFPKLGSKKLNEITSVEVDKLTSYMMDKKKLAPQTAKNCEAVIKKALNDAVTKKYLPYYPLAGLEKIIVPDTEVSILDKEEQKLLLKTAFDYVNNMTNPDHRRLILIYTLLNTGMRYGELCGLQWKNVKLNDKQPHIWVFQQCIFADGNSKPKLSNLKTKTSKRKIYLTKQDIQIIKRYRSWIYKTKFCETSYLLKEEPFIEHNMGGFLHKDFGRSTMRTILRLAELPHYTVHSLRHSHVSNLANKNVPIKYISERLGHSSVTVTMDRYAHVFPDQSAEYIEKAQPNFSLELG